MPGALEALDAILQGVDGATLTAQMRSSSCSRPRSGCAITGASKPPCGPTVCRPSGSSGTSISPFSRRRGASLHQLGFVERRENVIFLGPPGVDKTHLAISLAIAAQSGRRVYYGTLAELRLVPSPICRIFNRRNCRIFDRRRRLMSRPLLAALAARNLLWAAAAEHRSVTVRTTGIAERSRSCSKQGKSSSTVRRVHEPFLECAEPAGVPQGCTCGTARPPETPVRLSPVGQYAPPIPTHRVGTDHYNDALQLTAAP